MSEKEIWKGEQVTRAWARYERGRSYNNRLTPNQYDLVNTNIEFFAGNQWKGLRESSAMRRLPKPVFNIIKRVASLFVASLTSSASSISFDELSYYSGSPVVGEPGGDLSGGWPGGTLSEPEASNRRGLSEDPPPGSPALATSGAGLTRAVEPVGGSPATRRGESEDVNGAEVATAEVQNLLEKFKMDYRIREALFDGAQTGDYCAHFWWDPEAMPYGGAFGAYRGEIQMELVDGINVMFGNPNTPDVEKQPYILIVGRDTLEHLREELKLRRRERGGEGDELQADSDYLDMAGQGGQVELEADAEDGKALYVYMYEKKTGTVHVTKATRSCTIYEDVDTGLSRYPIAWGNWEKQKNQYHGRALVTGIIPNQIFINRMFAMVMRHLQLMGFPKTVYNADLISEWSNEVGQAIGVRGIQPQHSMNEAQIAYNLQPADMSAQILTAIDRAVTYTKDCLGATDAQLGNVKPDNTSALMVLQSSAEVPLENTRAGLYEWLEDVGAILLDMMGTYYGLRPMVRDREFDELLTDPATGAPLLDPMTGTLQTTKVTRRVVVEYDFSKFKHLWFNVRVNAGATTYYSEIAMIQTLDNLRHDGALELIDYLERIPDKLIPRKAELVRELKEKTAQGATAPQDGGGGEGAGLLGGPLREDRAVANLPVGVQARYGNLPASAKRSLQQVGSMKQ